MPGVSSSWNEANSTTPWGSEGLVAYGVVMSLILTTGLTGNILTIIVLMRREHRSKVITPFMINVAVLDLIIIALGYPVAIIANFTGIRMKEGDSQCQWTAFINGATGIAAIITLTAMSIVMRNTITHPIVKKRLSCKYLFGSLCAIWTYGILTMLPPLVGWSKFVPGAAKVSCGPDWETQNASTLSYNIVLLIVGFVIPVGIISACYLNIFRFLRSQPVPPAFICIVFSTLVIMFARFLRSQPVPPAFICIVFSTPVIMFPRFLRSQPVPPAFICIVFSTLVIMFPRFLRSQPVPPAFICIVFSTLVIMFPRFLSSQPVPPAFICIVFSTLVIMFPRFLRSQPVPPAFICIVFSTLAIMFPRFLRSQPVPPAFICIVFSNLVIMFLSSQPVPPAFICIVF
ncbi:visual pigment-like receptor peropsin [Nematostella vectensis]|uniref:visual pigment-like receptor peropsin n=1 Tax=Nematostella vectensis TaxID=45351 RepID=UPI002077356D|nr:visual pigment-like receptor peropsin [Nematostella vectensis]